MPRSRRRGRIAADVCASGRRGAAVEPSTARDGGATAATPPDGARPRRRRVRRALAGLAVTLLVLVLAVVVAFQVSYWPTTLLLRYQPDLNGTAAQESLARHVPDGVEEVLDEQYRPDDPDGRLDVFRPADATGPLPVVVWVHGGAFVAGTKDGTASYLKILASHGYTTVSVEYTKAPSGTTPTRSSRSPTRSATWSATPTVCTWTPGGSCWPATPRARTWRPRPRSPSRTTTTRGRPASPRRSTARRSAASCSRAAPTT
ncbi:alpha/beta hydrolase fold domain-containing protein [Cellulomonas sp. JZ18]|nr:alpha/beta hydrolase fold domain-containing protein [Cellulomonas sp. JZ18]